MISKILNTYGTAVTLCHKGQNYAVRVLFQPVRSKSWKYLNGEYSPLGEISRGQYVYIGPVDPVAEAGDTVCVGSKAYLVRQTEQIYDANGPVYCWGMCVEKGGEDNWGTRL